MKKIVYGTFSISIAIIATGCSGKANKMDEKAQKNQSIDVSYLDTTVNPGDDFFEYVNKKWLEKNPIPASKSSWGMFSFLNENSLSVLKDIQEKASKDNTAK